MRLRKNSVDVHCWEKPHVTVEGGGQLIMMREVVAGG